MTKCTHLCISEDILSDWIVAQLVERPADNGEVVGSSPIIPIYVSLAQMVEHQCEVLGVPGSIPGWYIPYLFGVVVTWMVPTHQTRVRFLEGVFMFDRLFRIGRQDVGKEVKTTRTEMPDLSYCGKSRYMCDVLSEMRDCVRTLNFSYMRSLIEEAQVLANRMEGGLSDVKSLKSLAKDLSKLKDARKALRLEVEALIETRDKSLPEAGTL